MPLILDINALILWCINMTTNWSEYLKASYQIVAIAERNVQPVLDATLESYLANMLSSHFRDHSFGEKPVAISLMEAMSLPGFQKKQSMVAVGDECLFVWGFGIKKNKWPSKNYYFDMGRISYGNAAIAIQPDDPLYYHLEQNFAIMGKVLNQIGKMI